MDFIQVRCEQAGRGLLENLQEQSDLREIKGHFYRSINKVVTMTAATLHIDNDVQTQSALDSCSCNTNICIRNSQDSAGLHHGCLLVTEL